MQSKSLVDLLQLECLSAGSSALRITQGSLEGRIWVQSGDIVDAVTGELKGEAAFREILSWTGGHFEILPAEANHPRTIHGSYQALLLDSAQALDEEKGAPQQAGTEFLTRTLPLAALGRFEGVEFVLAIPADDKAAVSSWGGENVDQIAVWARDAWQRMRQVGHEEKGLLCAGFRRVTTPPVVEQTMKQLFAKWAS
jgi:hypothetical protein